MVQIPTATGPGSGAAADGERLRKTHLWANGNDMFILSFSSIIW